jgi:hypothetical protein
MQVYPRWDTELEKEKQARETGHSVEIGDFLSWLLKKYILATYYSDPPYTNEYLGNAAYGGINGLLEKYFDIDIRAAEDQRRMLLEYIRWRNNQDVIVQYPFNPEVLHETLFEILGE